MTTPQQRPATTIDEGMVRGWLIEQIGRASNTPPDAVDTGAPFAYFGLNSLQYIELVSQLEDWIGREVPPTAAYDFPTIDLLSRYVAHALGEPSPAAISPETWI